MTTPSTHTATGHTATGHTDAARTGIIGLYKAFWRHAAGNRPLVAVFLALLFLAQAVRLAIPYFFGEAVNSLQASGAQDIALAGWNMALMFGACVLAWAMHGPGRVLERFMAIRIREKFADTLYAKAVSLPLRWHESHHSGETIQRMAKATHALFGFSQNQFIPEPRVSSVAGGHHSMKVRSNRSERL